MKINNKDGFLSDYGLSCGYIHRLKIGDFWLELQKEHGAYNVNLYNHRKYKHIYLKGFYSLIEAKKEFFKLSKKYFKLSKQKTLDNL